MGEVVPRTQLSWSVTASLGLHLAVALLLAFRLGVSEAPKPIGIEALYLGEMKLGEIKSAVPLTEVMKKRPAAAEKVERPKAEPVSDASAPPAEVGPAAQVAGAESTSTTTPNSLPLGVRNGAIVSAIERYKYELRLFLESRKIYPETAKRLRQAGTVIVAFKVSASGEMQDIVVEAPAGSELLNRAALDLVKGAPRFKPLPEQMNELKVSLPIEYIL